LKLEEELIDILVELVGPILNASHHILKESDLPHTEVEVGIGFLKNKKIFITNNHKSIDFKVKLVLN